MDTLEDAGDRLVADPVAQPASLEELRARTTRRQRRRTTGRLAAAAVVVAMVAGSLQFFGGTDTQEVEIVDQPDAGAQTFQDLLRRVPAIGAFTDGVGQLSMYDYASVREVLDIVPPGEDSEDLERYILELPDALRGGLVWWGRAAPDEVRAELGFDPGHIDRLVHHVDVAGVEDSVPESVVIAEGGVDPDTVDRTVRAVPYWGERTVAEPIDGGATLYRWGDDPIDIDIEHRTPVRPLGRSNALAVADGWSAFTLRPSTAQAAADVRDGDGPSLADSAEVRRLVELADRQGAHAVGITRQGRLSEEGQRRRSEGGPPQIDRVDWTLNTWRTGPDGAASATFALLIDDAAAAADAMELLADHDPERDGGLVWITVDGAPDVVAAELTEAGRAVGLLLE